MYVLWPTFLNNTVIMLHISVLHPITGQKRRFHLNGILEYVIQNDTKERELLICVVAAMYSW